MTVSHGVVPLRPGHRIFKSEVAISLIVRHMMVILSTVVVLDLHLIFSVI
jgi:hypothetical protein